MDNIPEQYQAEYQRQYEDDPAHLAGEVDDEDSRVDEE